MRDLLSRVPIFAGLDATALDELARRVTFRRAAAGEAIGSDADRGPSLFLVRTGRARIAEFAESGREVTLRLLRPGDLFGEQQVFGAPPRGETVVAVTDCTLMEIPRDAVLAHLQAHPATALRLLAVVAARLRRADEMIGHLALCDVNARLIRTLVGLARDEGGEAGPEGVALRSRPTQQELANMVGTCRETVSRAVSALARRGLIRWDGRALVLSSRLLAMAAPQARAA